MPKKSLTKVTIHQYGVSLNRGLRLIQRFKRLNHVEFKLEIKLDFSEKDLGYFNYDPEEKIIYINPIRCKNYKINHLLGHPVDCSIYATVTHEFAHFLDLKYDLMQEYTSKNFTLESLIMTRYAKNEVIEQLADMITIYFTNPYYLKLIDIERYKWIKTKFKSPRPCGIKTFIKYYNNWPEKKKQLLLDSHGDIIRGIEHENKS